jgi:hypothetical protein
LDEVSIISGPELDCDQTKLKPEKHEEVGDITTQVKNAFFRLCPPQKLLRQPEFKTRVLVTLRPLLQSQHRTLLP